MYLPEYCTSIIAIHDSPLAWGISLNLDHVVNAKFVSFSHIVPAIIYYSTLTVDSFHKKYSVTGFFAGMPLSCNCFAASNTLYLLPGATAISYGGLGV